MRVSVNPYPNPKVRVMVRVRANPMVRVRVMVNPYPNPKPEGVRVMVRFRVRAMVRVNPYPNPNQPVESHSNQSEARIPDLSYENEYGLLVRVYILGKDLGPGLPGDRLELCTHSFSARPPDSSSGNNKKLHPAVKGRISDVG